MIWDQLLARPENFVQCFMTGGDIKIGGPLMLWARVSQQVITDLIQAKWYRVSSRIVITCGSVGDSADTQSSELAWFTTSVLEVINNG